MTSKYANLPDIDTSNPDVYETPDVPAALSFNHDSDSDGEYGNDSLTQSPSAQNLLNSAAQRNSTQAGPSDDIDNARLRPGDARSKFVNTNPKVNGGNADFSPALVNSRRHRYPTTLFPESSVYSIHNAASTSRGLSSTSRRQLRTQSAIEGDSGNTEPETKTERLRRLRFEIEELETEIEADRAATADDNGDMNDGYEYEEEDVIEKKDNADKTRPPKRRKKRLQHDVNGELSPVVLLSQLKRLRHNLSALGLQDSNVEAGDPAQGSSQTQAKELLAQLQKGRSPQISIEGETSRNVPDLRSARDQSESSTSRIDARLEALEKYIGANEADVEENRSLPAPLLSTLARVEHQLQLLTQPRHLDTISRRVKLLVNDLERIHEARRKIGDTRPLNIALSSGISISTGSVGLLSTPSAGGGGSDQPLPPDALQKIDGLFSLLPRIEPLVPLTPHLLNRLRSLSTLHAASQTFSTDLQDAEGSLESLKQSEGFLKDLLVGLRESLENNQKTVSSNMASLGGRVDELLQRLDKLVES